MKRVQNTATRSLPSVPEYHSAIQLILIKSYPVYLQGSVFAFTCLEFVNFLNFTPQSSLIPTHPSQLHGPCCRFLVLGLLSKPGLFMI